MKWRGVTSSYGTTHLNCTCCECVHSSVSIANINDGDAVPSYLEHSLIRHQSPNQGESFFPDETMIQNHLLPHFRRRSSTAAILRQTAQVEILDSLNPPDWLMVGIWTLPQLAPTSISTSLHGIALSPQITTCTHTVCPPWGHRLPQKRYQPARDAEYALDSYLIR